MKAAFEAWGASSNLFHQGVAKETDDPDVVAATMSNPGSSENVVRRERRRAKRGKRAAPKLSERAARKATADFEKEQKRREAELRREEAARERDCERREKATAKAQAALDEPSASTKPT